MTDNIIELSDVFFKLNRKVKGRNKSAGLMALEAMGDKTASLIISFILSVVETEVNLGLHLIDDNDQDPKLPIYERISALYEEASGGCYFCSDEYDPNADEINSDTIFCMMCKFKLRNFVQALGLHPGEIFHGMRSSNCQTSTINRRKHGKDIEKPIS